MLRILGWIGERKNDGKMKGLPVMLLIKSKIQYLVGSILL